MIRPDGIHTTVMALRAGKPAIFPTDTIYGLGVAVEHSASSEVLYSLKQRDEHKPIAWLVGSIDALQQYGKAIPEFTFALVRTFWPGPLTVIVKASDAVPQPFRSEEGTIGLRMPCNQKALQLISEVGCPIATTSANISGKAPATSFDALDEKLLLQVGAVLVDKEPKSGIASTIIDCTAEHPVVNRVGAISVADIQALC